MATPPAPPPLEPGFYPTRDNEETRRLLAAKNEARSRWRRTHVELDSAARRDSDLALEAHDTHLEALHDWRAAEASYIAARLGFSAQPLPKR